MRILDMPFRFIKRNEKTMRADSLARKLQNNSHNESWKEVRMMNNCKTSLPSNIFGVSGAGEISQLGQKHYYDLFYCIKSNLFIVGNIDNNKNAFVSTVSLRCSHEAGR